MNHSSKLLICAQLILFLIPITAHSDVFTPNIFTDQVDTIPGDGLCQTDTGDCSLRAAIQESNAIPGPHTINLDTGTYYLSIAGRFEHASAQGDLDITNDTIINGQGAAYTIINGGSIDRVFDVRGSDGQTKVILNNLSITGGAVNILVGETLSAGGFGGGILVSDVDLTLNGVWIYNNTAFGMGGGIFTIFSKLTLNHSLTYDNQSSAGGGISAMNGNTYLNDSFIFYSEKYTSFTATTFFGGGIFNFGNLYINNSALYQNRSQVDGGAIYHGLGILKITNSTLNNNEADKNGGAIYYRMGGIGLSGQNSETPSLVNVSIVNNVAKKLPRSGDPVSSFIPSVESFEFTQTSTIDVLNTIDFTVPEGESPLAIGGGGILVVGQYGENQPLVKLGIVNSIIANNYDDSLREIPGDCRNTTDGEILSFGYNVDSDDSCNFTHVNDLASGTDLKLVALNVTNVTQSATGSPPNFTQSQYNKLIPYTQLIASDSPLRDAANDAYCPDDDQRRQTRPVIGCDIGAYEFLPPVASPMQFVAKPGDVVTSSFTISDPAEKSVTYQLLSSPSQGNVSQTAGTSFPDWSYTANIDATGSDQFTFKACFSTGECSNTATIGITIITEPAVTDTVSINILSELGGSASSVDIINEAELIAGLEDTDYTFPVGAIFFSIEDIPVNSPDSLIVELQLPANTVIPTDAVVRKLDNTGTWRTLASSPSLVESTGVIDPINKTITLTLLDNDVFDSNPAVGEIRDPVALAIPVNTLITTEATDTKADSSGKSSGSLHTYSLLILMLISSIRMIRRKW